MKINVYGKNMQVTDAIKEYSEKKVSKLTKYFDEILNINVSLEVQKNLHIAEVLVDVKGMFLKGLERSEDLYASIDLSVDKIEKQLIKYKDKLRTHKNSDKDTGLNMDVYDVNTVQSTPDKIVSKSISSKPMDIDEAVMQMDLMNKNFFVFRNSKNDELNVVYKRDDGNIGLIKG